MVEDNHVPPQGRDLIRKTLHEAGIVFSWYEVAWAQRKQSLLRHFCQGRENAAHALCADAFIRDELSKGRYDPAISKICFEMLLELFGRTLKLDVGDRSGGEQKIEDVC